MSERLTALDATFLELEEADDSAHMHIGAVMVFDPLPGGGAPSVEELRSQLERRLGALPRYRQRLGEARTGGLRWPSWEEDQTFDVARHVRREALPWPGDEATLTEWAGEFFSHRLDRARPLWETVVVEGLQGGRWALGSKTHHCMVDGVGSVDVSHLLLDSAADAPAEPAEAGASGRHPAAAPPESHGWQAVPAAAVHAARVGLDAALHPGRLMEALERSRAMVEVLVRDEAVGAPACSLNAPIGGHRRYAVVRSDLAELKSIKDALGGTVNDVVLAVVTGGLRHLLLERGEQPPEGLRAMVPMNIREASEHLALGNKVSSLFVHLPVAEADPLMRYVKAREEAEGLKAGTQAKGTTALMDLTAMAPPVLHSTLARGLFASRLFNVTVTNVPGPQMALYAHGAQLREVWPLVPLAAEHALGVAILSYDGKVVFGVNADRDSVPDLEEMTAGMTQGLAELRAATAAMRAASATVETTDDA